MNYDRLTERDILDLVKSKAMQIGVILAGHVDADMGAQVATIIDDLTKLGADIRERIAEIATENDKQ